MSEAGQQSRITVSEDKLDAKLTGLELRLVDRITKALDVKADQAYVEQLHARIHTLEGTSQANTLLIAAFKTSADDVEKRLRGLERFRYAIPSAAAISAGIALAVSVYTFLH